MNEKSIKSSGRKKRATLGAEEERELLKKAQEAFKRARKSEKVPRDLLKAAQTLVYRSKTLVKYLAYGYSFFSDSTQEEKVSAGIEVFPKAIEKFDLKFKGRFVTYLGHWVKQHFQSLSKKSAIISKSTVDPKGSSNVILYDQNDDSSNRETYTFSDTLYDGEDLDFENGSMRKADIFRTINDLIEKLDDPKDAFLIRLSYGISPITLYDIYFLSDDNDKKKIERKVKSVFKNELTKKCGNFDFFLKSKIISKSPEMSDYPIVKRIINLFSEKKRYSFLELSKIFNEKESYLRRRRKNALIALKNKSEEEGKELEMFI